MFEKEAEEYAEGMAKYYESAHGSIPSQFEKYLRKAVEYGYNKANEWHNLRKNPNDLPDCDENKKLWLYFKDYYANDIDCEHPIYRTSTGVYKTSFLNEAVKLFAEKSKGYESEILPKDIIAWMYLPEPPKEIE